MSISGDYATPVIVNGYSCKNCTDVDFASKHIDPAHPQSGPNIDAKSDPSRADNPAVRFSGVLSGLNSAMSAADAGVSTLSNRPLSWSGGVVDISA